MCGCDVSCYHGDSRHMFRTSTRGGSDADKSRHAKVHAQTHACPHIHIHTPRASGTGNCQEESESTFSSFSGSFHSETALWRLKYIQSYPLKKYLIYSLLYSHQPLCLLFISALLMFIFIAISNTSLSVLFQSVSKVKFSPSKPSSPKIFQTPTHLFFTFIFIFMALNSILYTWARGYCVYMRSEILMKKKESGIKHTMCCYSTVQRELSDCTVHTNSGSTISWKTVFNNYISGLKKKKRPCLIRFS